MEGPAYARAFARQGLALATPPLAERKLVDRVIFDELCQGGLKAASRDALVRVIAAMKAEGCDAVVLGCTELPRW